MAFGVDNNLAAGAGQMRIDEITGGSPYGAASITTELADLTYHVNFYSKKFGDIQF